MDKKFYDALASCIYLQSMALAGRSVTTDDQKLRASGLYSDWAVGSFSAGDIRNSGGQTWECFQAHDNAVYPDIRPGNTAWYTFWRPLHGKSPTTARRWVAPMGAHDTYKADEYMIWTDGSVWHCLLETAYSPVEHPAAWEVSE